MKFQCPDCGQPLETQTMYSGQNVNCPKCGANVVIPVSTSSESDISSSVPAPSQPIAKILTSEPARKYEVGSVLAQGGMGAILNAKDVNLRRSVAMKVMLENCNASEEQVLRFVEEAQVTGQLEHPGIVPLYELGLDPQGNVFYTMKFVKGRTLGDILKKIGEGDSQTIKDYSLAPLLTIFQKVCDAIAFAHSKRVIHRDLKPENIMVGDYGEVLVMDWGLAKVLQKKARKLQRHRGTKSEIGNQKLEIGNEGIDSVRKDEGSDILKTMDGSIMGTPGFMSPEQALGKTGEIDERADIYALGAILYNILTLHVTITGNGLTEMIDKISKGEIPNPSRYNPTSDAKNRQVVDIDNISFKKTKAAGTIVVDLKHLPDERVPESLAAVAMKALDVQAHRRYQTVKELQKEIEAYQGGYATGAEMAGTWKQFVLFVKRHKAVATLTLLISILIITASIVSTNLWIRSEKARRKAQDTLHALQQTAPALVAQTKAFIEQQNMDKALSTISYAIEIVPESAELRCIKGNLLQALLEISEAEQAYNEALTLDPTHKLAKENKELCRNILIKDNGGKISPLSVLTLLYPAMLKQQRFDEAMIMARRFFPGTMTLEGVYKQVLISRGAKCNSLTIDEKGLCTVDLKGTSVTNLAVLNGMPIRRLNIWGTKVNDLTPLKDLPLIDLNLNIGETKVSNLSPLQGLPLTSLQFTPKNIKKGIGIIREMKTLKEIGIGSENGQYWSASEFWKKYDAGEFNK